MDVGKNLASQFRWRVDNVISNYGPSSDVVRLYSPIFKCAGISWYIQLSLLHGEESGDRTIAVYLAPKNANQLFNGWPTPDVKYTLTIENQVDVTRSIVRESIHTFDKAGEGWGFKNLLKLEQVREGGFLKDDASIIITAEIFSCRLQPTALLFPYGSNKETGYVGLKAQSTIWVANPLLQSLYHIPYLQRAVCRTPITEVESEASRVMLELQRLFCHMLVQDGSVDTKDLLKSLGWGGGQKQPQPLGEFCHSLFQKMEEKSKGTAVEGTTRRLFEGQSYNNSRSAGLDNAGSCLENFYTLKLDVQGCKDIYASLD
eukprot:jgi/Mesvir1/5927/Mv00695-RA.1